MPNETTTINIEGMNCMHCAGAVKRAIEALPGVESVDVDLAGKKAVITHQAGQPGLDALKTAVAGAGYKVV